MINGQGSIVDCTITGRGQGVRIHGSRLALVGGSCIGLATGMEAEGSSEVLVHHVRFERNGTALHARDASVLHADGSSFMGNDLVLRTGTARSGNGSRIVLYTNEFVDNVKDREVEEGSRVEQQEAMDAGTLRTFGLGATPVVQQPVPPRNGRSRRADQGT